jgi:hypothetical protein
MGTWPVDRLRNFAARSNFQKVWFAPVWLGLGMASLGIVVVPSRHIARHLGDYKGLDVAEVTITERQRECALEIRRTVQWAAAHAPWRADCYPQAIVARFLLGLYRMPFVLCLGLRNPHGEQLEAHAWVTCGEVCVSGDSGLEQYRIVAVYAKSGGKDHI